MDDVVKDKLQNQTRKIIYLDKKCNMYLLAIHGINGKVLLQEIYGKLLLCTKKRGLGMHSIHVEAKNNIGVKRA